MALWDSMVRVLLGLLLITLGILKGGVFTIAVFIGIILTITAITGFCPLYKIAGISSKEEG
ncbi:MAG: DUF2892 domain-containing protein [Hydrogenothermaceae bacterium]|nr:DUF2892 domain-containing protein [Hydrogenothermaceae bacterium]